MFSFPARTSTLFFVMLCCLFNTSSMKNNNTTTISFSNKLQKPAIGNNAFLSLGKCLIGAMLQSKTVQSKSKQTHHMPNAAPAP